MREEKDMMKRADHSPHSLETSTRARVMIKLCVGHMGSDENI